MQVLHLLVRWNAGDLNVHYNQQNIVPVSSACLMRCEMVITCQYRYKDIIKGRGFGELF